MLLNLNNFSFEKTIFSKTMFIIKHYTVLILDRFISAITKPIDYPKRKCIFHNYNNSIYIYIPLYITPIFRITIRHIQILKKNNFLRILGRFCRSFFKSLKSELFPTMDTLTVHAKTIYN